MRKLNEKQQEELDFIKKWSLFIIQKIEETSGKPGGLAMFVGGINEAYEKQNLRGMRYVFKDINEWARGISPVFENNLNVLLKEKFGKGLNYFSGKNPRKIKQIRKRGKILNPDECRLVAERVGEIYADEAKNEELAALNSLLRGYEQYGKPEV